MFDLEKEIRKWKKVLYKHEVFDDGVITDLELHLRKTYQTQREAGLPEEEAFRSAAAQVGEADKIAAEYDKNRLAALIRHAPLHPRRFLPALVWHYIKTALRIIRRRKAYTFINISGLAIGLCVCMLIVLWVADEWSFDRFHTNADRIFRVYRDESATQMFSTSALTPPPMAAALKQDFPDIIRSTRFGYWRRQLVTYRDKSFNETRYMHVDPDFFHMFSFPLLKGDPDTVFANPYSIVLTEKTAAKYFGEEDPIGKTLTVNNRFDVIITGIIRRDSLKSSLEFDLLSPFDILIKESLGEEVRDNWGFNSFGTYVLLEAAASLDNLNRHLKDYLNKKYSEEDTDALVLQPLTDIHLFSNLGHDLHNRGDIKYVWIFSALAVFVLLIACVNFVNLTTARSVRRAKEVGLRKVVGANRRQLIRQFFAESVLMSLLALIFALLLVECLLPLFNNLSGKELSSSWLKNPSFLLIFIGLALLTGLLSGIYPALFLSSFQPVRVLKGSMFSTRANPLFRKVLVIFQFSLSVFLITGTLIISRQLSYLRHTNLGFNREHIIYVSIHGKLHEQYNAIRERFLQHPDVLHVTASMALPTNIQSTPGTPMWEGKDPETVMEIKADFIDYDYIETFEISLVEGRSFSREFGSDPETAFIVNEEAVRRMGLESPVVGKKFGFWGIDGRIIGVMKDAHFQSLHHKIEPLVFKMFPDWLRRMYVKVRSGDMALTLASLEKTWDGMNTGYPFEVRFLDEDFENLYKQEARLENIFRVFAALAVFIACLGLFGLASFIAEQRTKEIGIRKVLGSSTAGIVGLLNRDFLKWILTAAFFAWPAAYLAMHFWLQKFAYRIPLEIWMFFLAASIGLAVGLITVSLQTLKAARTHPANSLKHE
ncbi:MAG: ABC transporter permease [Candidatus Aminicenantes bacterium]|nr:ABC transporter permease [Candidatus Aminicenantes bacterium]